MLEGHPLAARFLGSHPLTTKGPGRPESGKKGGSREARGPFTKSHRPPSLEAFTPPHLHPHGSSLSPPLSPLQPSDTPAQANYQALCSCTASLILMCIRKHTVHNSACYEVLSAALHARGNISLLNLTRTVLSF